VRKNDQKPFLQKVQELMGPYYSVAEEFRRKLPVHNDKIDQRVIDTIAYEDFVFLIFFYNWTREGMHRPTGATPDEMLGCTFFDMMTARLSALAPEVFNFAIYRDGKIAEWIEVEGECRHSYPYIFRIDDPASSPSDTDEAQEELAPSTNGEYSYLTNDTVH
jgi:hypothetical protein